MPYTYRLFVHGNVFFNDKTISKFISLVLNGFQLSATDTLAILKEPLKELFLIRLANYRLKWGLKAMSYHKFCSFEANKISFDVREFIERYLHKNKKFNDLKEFSNVITAYRGKVKADCRSQINGHDFTDLLSWLIKESTGHEVMNPEVVRRSLTGCLEKNTLLQEGLFIRLISRLQV